MATTYEWAVEITTQYLKDNEEPDGEPIIEVRIEASGESGARARLDHIQRSIARGWHPKWGKITGARLLQRPIAPWVEVKD